MNKEQAITSFMKAVKTYTNSIDKSAQANISYKKALYALEDAVNQIYRDVDVKELGSNSEQRNAKISAQTSELVTVKRELEYQLEVARAEESRAKTECDQVKYIIRALEVKDEA